MSKSRKSEVKKIKMRWVKVCHDCHGSRKLHKVICKRCGGSGKIITDPKTWKESPYVKT